ncbi:hypothetical protein R3P38DRAFT_2814565 [Favolaschia claudopus]|uniref:Uncharacterized protein n=1 Tax=Favolaschia claudopus TaxID=2862362 RepID=A0AAV9Z336_9AGAR
MGDGKSVAAAGLLWSPTVVVQGAKLGSKPTCPAAHHSSFKSNGPLLRENEGARFPGNNAGTCCFVIYLPPHLPGFQNCLLGKIHYEGNLRQFCTDCLGCRLKLKLSKRAIRISTTPGVSRCQNGMRCYPLHLGGLGHYEGNLGHFSTDCLGCRVDCQIPCPHYSEIFKGQMGWLGLELKRLNRATRVDYDRLKRTTSRYSSTGTRLNIFGDLVSGVLARFRDIDFTGIDTATDVKLRKEIEEHTIQQGSVRVNNGMQQNVGELATQTSPLS